jgi:hypothetical protein
MRHRPLLALVLAAGEGMRKAGRPHAPELEETS